MSWSLLLGALATAALAAPAMASAAAPATGGTPASSPAEKPALPSGSAGGTEYGSPLREIGAPPAKRPVRKRPAHRPPVRRRPRLGPSPVVVSFGVPRTVYAYGAPARIAFRINGGAKAVHVTLSLVHGGRRALSVDLGSQPTGRLIVYRLRPGSRLPEGRYHLHLHALDAHGRSLRAGADAATSRAIGVYSARFPVVGPHAFGGPDARFGAPRSGHVHQGQDVVAAEGTPLVAPRGGIVRYVAYQAAGAGYYVVIDGAGTARSYVLMHLEAGSTLVRVGQLVRTGQRIGLVGATGDASGPHLHFEIWEGPWYAGGHPIDPLPSLLRWDSYS